jgi:mono/diheme cytochrome c family protein
VRPAGAVLVVLALVVPACRRGPEHPPLDAARLAFRDGSLSSGESRGRRLFEARCATCHGVTGRGDGQNAYTLDPPPPDFSASLGQVPAAVRRQIVERGTAAVGRSPLCPPRTGALADGDADALLAYLDVLARQGDRPAPARRRGGGPAR